MPEVKRGLEPQSRPECSRVFGLFYHYDMSNNEMLLRVKDVAKLLNISGSLVYQMVEDGRIKAIRLPALPGVKKATIRIPAEEVFRILRPRPGGTKPEEPSSAGAGG